LAAYVLVRDLVAVKGATVTARWRRAFAVGVARLLHGDGVTALGDARSVPKPKQQEAASFLVDYVGQRNRSATTSS
jgi:hypothetical protein